MHPTVGRAKNTISPLSARRRKLGKREKRSPLFAGEGDTSLRKNAGQTLKHNHEPKPNKQALFVLINLGTAADC